MNHLFCSFCHRKTVLLLNLFVSKLKLTVFLQVSGILMCFHIIVLCLDNAYRYIGAMVGHSFIIVQNII